jgi:hypothetical protein
LLYRALSADSTSILPSIHSHRLVGEVLKVVEVYVLEYITYNDATDDCVETTYLKVIVEVVRHRDGS